MEPHLLLLLVILIIVDVIIVTSFALGIFNSLVFLKIRSFYKQNTTDFLNKIKRSYDWRITPNFEIYYPTYIFMALIIYLFLRSILFYVLQLKINLLYSVYMIYFLLIPLSFYFGHKTKIKNIYGIQNTIQVGNRDVPVGDIIFGIYTFFSFKEKPRFYGFLENTTKAFLKPCIVFEYLLYPIIIILFGIFYLINTNDFVIFFAYLFISITILLLFYSFKRNLRLTKFTVFVFSILFTASVIIAITTFSDPSFSIPIIFIIIFAILYLFRQKRKTRSI